MLHRLTMCRHCSSDRNLVNRRRSRSSRTRQEQMGYSANSDRIAFDLSLDGRTHDAHPEVLCDRCGLPFCFASHSPSARLRALGRRRPVPIERWLPLTIAARSPHRAISRTIRNRQTASLVNLAVQRLLLRRICRWWPKPSCMLLNSLRWPIMMVRIHPSSPDCGGLQGPSDSRRVA